MTDLCCSCKNRYNFIGQPVVVHACIACDSEDVDAINYWSEEELPSYECPCYRKGEYGGYSSEA